MQSTSPSLTSDREFIPWLQQQNISLAFTTYQTNWLAFIGVNAETGGISAFQRQFNRAMGLYCTPDRLYLSSKYQLWQLDNVLQPGQFYQGCDRLFIPRIAYTTGDIDVHDVAVTETGELIFISTLLNCLATTSDRHSCKPLWKPPFISQIINEDRCHLNGLAMVDGQPGYVTACSRSDVVDGWRDRRKDGGVAIDIASNEIVVTGLSMPHSPRFYQGKLWLLNSGTGEFGYVDLDLGKFEAVTFCPGYARGLAFWGNYAIVGLSKPRSGDGTFSGLLLDDRLKEKDADARCGLLIIDLNTGTIVHWVRIEGTITELYDVGVLPGVQKPMALGFQTQEIEQLISLEPLSEINLVTGNKKGGDKTGDRSSDSHPTSPLTELNSVLTLAQTNVQLSLVESEKTEPKKSNFPKIPPVAENTPRPFWSVMITIYNRLTHLEQALRSVLAQAPSADEMQIEVVNDGGDRSLQEQIEAIVKAVGGDRVTFYRHPPVGQSQIFNVCLSRARGQWIHILHDDDWVKPGFYQTLRSGIETASNVGAAFCRHIYVNATNSPHWVSWLERETPGILENWWEKIVVMQRIQPPSIVVKREAYERLGGFYPPSDPYQDWEMWKRIAVHYPFWYEPQILAAYRQHPESLSVSYNFAQVIRHHLKNIEISRTYLPPEVADRLSEEARECQANFVLTKVANYLSMADFSQAIDHIALALECSQSASVKQFANLFLILANGWQEYFNPPAAKLTQEVTQQETALTKLRTLRQQIAKICLNKPTAALPNAWAGNFGKLYQLLLNSSLKYESLTPSETELADRLGAEFTQNPRSLPTLLALMLYRQPHQLPRYWYQPVAVPAWLSNDYLGWMFAPPEIFSEVGEADRYCQYMHDWIGYLHVKISANPDSPQWQTVAQRFTYSHNFIPLYFNDANLKELYRMRAEMMELGLKSSGCLLEYQFPQHPPNRQKIRLGILNEHFNSQTETFTTLPIFEYLERENFEIILYVLQTNKHSLEQYCQSLSDRFVQLPPELADAVQRIRQDDLDILLIGTNVTAVAKQITLMAMHRLARIQITGFSSPVTTGIANVDYYISGKLTETEISPNQRYCEQLIALNGAGFCFQYQAIAPPAPTTQPQRQDWGANEETVIFISGANFYKIIPEVRQAWAKILAAVPNSILVLYPYGSAWNISYPKQPFERQLKATLEQYHIAPERLVILPSLPSRTDVKNCLKLADIYLDSFPYSGANSTVDPLEVGVPLVVMCGKNMRSRQGAAILLELHLGELVADTEESYINLAITLGTNSQLRQQYRDRIKQLMATTPRFLDSRTYGAEIGAVLQQLFRQWQAAQDVDTPDLADHQLLINQAFTYQQQGEFAQAIRIYQQVLSAEPDNALVLTNYSKALQKVSRHQEAIDILGRAIKLNPNNAQLYFSLSQSLKVQGDIETAAECLQKAIELQPDFWGAYNNLGTIFQQQGNLAEAAQCYAKALEYNPNFAQAQSNLGSIWQLQGDLERAKAGLIRALQLEPNYVPALLNLAYIYKQQGRLPGAIDCYQQVLAQEPRPEAYYHLGEIFNYQGNVLAALDCYQKVQELDPKNYNIEGAIAFTRLKICDWEDYESRTAELIQSVQKYLNQETAYSPSPLALSNFPVPLALHRQFAESLSRATVAKMAKIKAVCNFAYPKQTDKLKIGYISPDFREHAVGKIVKNMFEYCDRVRFEVYAYSTIDYNDAITETIRNGCDYFVNISAMTAEAAARKINADGIHILIDLAGRTIGNGEEILALQPAPIQAHFLGYPDTMGADFIQYAIGDKWLINPEIAETYTEEIIYLPHAFFSSPMEISEPMMTRAEFGIPEDAFVFCCFNSHYKITPDLFDIWMRILAQIPNSVLWLTGGSEILIANLRREAAKRGIDGNRLFFTEKLPNSEYLARYRLADLFLDTFIYNGGSTAISALYAGCPVLTRPGNTNAARMGASICAAAKLNSLICSSSEEYEKQAIYLATHPRSLGYYRRQLTKNRDQLPLFNVRGFVRTLENALWQMWELSR